MTKRLDDFDITAKIGELFPIHSETNPPEWPMYSFARPSRILWNALGKGLAAKGWTDKKIKEWLASKDTRWALDDDLGAALVKLGTDWADKVTGH